MNNPKWRCQTRHQNQTPSSDWIGRCGYGSIPINTIFRGMNIHKSQLFWCELQGYYWFWHTAMLAFYSSDSAMARSRLKFRLTSGPHGFSTAKQRNGTSPEISQQPYLLSSIANLISYSMYHLENNKNLLVGQKKMPCSYMFIQSHWLWMVKYH